MKTTFALCVLIALVLQIATAPVANGKIRGGKVKAAACTTAPAQSAPASQPARPGKGGELAALEKKMLGAWQGGPCVGDYTFNADGTYELKHFTPGNNTLTGTWSIRWDALPPTLVLICKTSDFKKRAPDWPEYEYLGKPLEVKLVELNNEILVFRRPKDKADERPDDKREQRYERPAEEQAGGP